MCENYLGELARWAYRWAKEHHFARAILRLKEI
jgi:hypothetical protein